MRCRNDTNMTQCGVYGALHCSHRGEEEQGWTGRHRTAVSLSAACSCLLSWFFLLPLGASGKPDMEIRGCSLVELYK